MLISLNEIEKAITCMENNCECENLVKFLKDECTTGICNIFNLENAISSVIWINEDIINALEEREIPTTEANIDAVLENLNIDHMEDEMVSSGWDLIQDAIDHSELKGGI